jgi:hypothetical protein
MILVKRKVRFIDYAKEKGISPSAVTQQVNKGKLKVILENGRRYIEVQE